MGRADALPISAILEQAYHAAALQVQVYVGKGWRDGRPGMVRIVPNSGKRKPAPALARMSVMGRVQF